MSKFAQKKAPKRKAPIEEPPKQQQKEKPKRAEKESDYESDEENLFGEIDNEQGDSSDSEGEFESDDEAGAYEKERVKEYSEKSDYGTDQDKVYTSDDDDEELSFEDASENDSLVEDSPDEDDSEPEPDSEVKEESPEPEEVRPSTSALLEAKLEEKPTNPNDEYADGDTSDEEDIRNTIGNIPMHWYDEFKHIGYDWDANKIVKPAQKDQLDEFLRRMEDPNFWRTVKDPQTGQEVVLSEEDISLIKNIMAGRAPNQRFNSYEPWIEWFSSEVEKLPVVNVPDHKRSFLPSKGEKKKIGRLVHSLKMGWMKTMAEQRAEAREKRRTKFFMLWDSDHGVEKMRRIHDHVPAPKRPLPGHAESYNPPPEYLFDEEEMKEWERLADEPHKRKLHFLPQKYGSLREVPAYDRFIKERFNRCLDLYLCPRAKRMKPTVQPEDLIPKLPSARDLQPFPSQESLVYRGHTNIVRSISIEPRGEYICTGSDDCTVRVWEIRTARCVQTVTLPDIIRSVAWCPNPKLLLIAAATGSRVVLINPRVGDKLMIRKTDDLLEEAPRQDIAESERVANVVTWTPPDAAERGQGVRLVLQHFRDVKQVTWHGKGDYFATVMPDGANRSVLIHQLSKRRSQVPFSKSKGLVQAVLFHPIKPCIFVATQRHVRIYDLVKQELVKKLITNCRWISGMAIHPRGDNLLVSSYDKKVMWFDLDLSTKPYQTLRLHNAAVRNVAFHLRYPLFASVSDDRSVIVCHGMVYNDLLQNALIVPLKRLEYHDRWNEYGVLDLVFHPIQPWVFSTGADHTVRLYS